MDCYKYMLMPIKIIPEHIIEQYNLCVKAKNGYVYMKIRHTMHGLSQAGILENKLLKNILPNMTTMKLPTHLASGNTSLARLVLLSLSMSLESSMLVKNMPNTFSMHSKNIIPLTLTWPANCSVVFPYKKKTVDISMPSYIKKLLL
ncbi:hypothetical protein ACHAW6_006128 [Cyclotella cf. meneghiniana]